MATKNFGNITTYTGTGFPSVNALIYDIALALTNADPATPGSLKPPTTGNAAPLGQQWMWQVSTTDAAKFDKTKAFDPATITDEDPITWVFEASQLIDPYAQITPDGFIITSTDATPGATYGVDTVGTNPLDTTAAYPYIPNAAKDPWRICFQSFKWKNYAKYTKSVTGSPPVAGSWTPDAGKPKTSLGVYVGTPATLGTINGADLNIGYRQNWPNRIPQWAYDGVADENSYNLYTDAVSNNKMPTTFLNKKIYDFVEPQGNTGARWTHNFQTDVTDPKVVWGSPIPSPAPNPPANWVAYPVPVATGDGDKGDGPDISDPGQTFINRYSVRGSKSALFGSSTATGGDGNPMSYHLVFSDHGMFLAVWAQNPEETASNYSWLLIQRPVDKKTGVVRGVSNILAASDPLAPNSGKYGDPGNAGNRPLFCINSTNNSFYKFVVREHDLPIPSIPKDAANNSEDNGAVLNSYPQQSLTENGEYVITFINNLNSSRFKYADELDMLGTVSADIVGGGTDIDVSVYNEIDPSTGQPIKRTYHALWPHGKFGTKMRVVVVKAVPNPNAPA